MKHLWIANTWINALLKEFQANQLDIVALTNDLPGFEDGEWCQGDRLDLLSARILWHRAEKLTGDVLLGAKVGVADNQRSIGVLSPILWHSDSIGLALQNIAKFQTLISENGVFRIEFIEATDELFCVYEEMPAAINSPAQQKLSVTVGLINVVKTLSGGEVMANRLTIPNGMPVGPFKRMLGIDVVNQDDVVGMAFSREALGKEIPGCDKTLYQNNLDYANALLNEKNMGSDFIQKIRRYIANHGLVAADINVCAAQLNTYPRNIQRQLVGYGTNFRRIKEEVVKERVISELHKGTDIKDIAYAIGYSEISGFYRAFKGWFGMTPKQAVKTGVF